MESDNAEENFSTKQSPTSEKTRLQITHGDQERTRRSETTPGQRPQTPDAAALLDFSFPKEARLRKRAEFLRVYEQGERIEGRFLTVFILPNSLGRHRVGITATRKAIGKAHDRNRAKRLLRETFRLSRLELNEVRPSFDWVLNARRALIRGKLDRPLTEFRGMLTKLAIENTKGHRVV